MKKVSIKMPARGADEWIAERGAEVPHVAHSETEPTKRLTIDLPKSLHKRVKQGCAEREITIADLVRDLLLREFPRA